MRLLFTLIGVSCVVLYSVIGALLMNDWALTAASGVPLAETIREMNAAGQPYSAAAGIIFALAGGVLALAWGFLVLSRQFKVPGWAECALWSGIVAFGAPAFFFASFGNMNSVGDTFFDWNAEAAFAREAPLYLTSGVAVMLGVVAVVAVIARTISRRGASGTPTRPEQIQAPESSPVSCTCTTPLLVQRCRQATLCDFRRTT